jgi:hypothetical protein
MDFADTVQVITQIVTAVTAVVMAFFAYRTYLSAPDQESETDPESATDVEAAEELTEILVFKTANQKTFLALTNQGIECRIEDVRAGKGGPQWIISRANAAAILESRAYQVNPGYKVKTGMFSIGSRKNWLYTKSLFPDPDYLQSVLKKLLENACS